MDEARKLAYDALSARLTQQDATLGNLRNRATWMLTVSALVASFAAGLGLIHTSSSSSEPVPHRFFRYFPSHFSAIPLTPLGTTANPSFPHWAAYTLLALVTAIGFLVCYVFWPKKRFVFGPNGQDIMTKAGDGKDVDTILYEVITDALIPGRKRNNDAIEWRMRAFRAASVLFIVESIVFIIAVVTN